MGYAQRAFVQSNLPVLSTKITIASLMPLVRIWQPWEANGRSWYRAYDDPLAWLNICSEFMGVAGEIALFADERGEWRFKHWFTILAHFDPLSWIVRKCNLLSHFFLASFHELMKLYIIALPSSYHEIWQANGTTPKEIHESYTKDIKLRDPLQPSCHNGYHAQSLQGHIM